MNIAFWSPYRGTGVSSSMLAIALTTVLDKHLDCSLLQLHFDGNGLFQSFMPDTDTQQISTFENTGIDSLLRLTRGGVAAKDAARSSSFGYLDNQLNVFAGTKMQTERVYQLSLQESFANMFLTLNDTFRVNFIDTPAGINVYSDKALLLADMIVVCLPQSEWKLKDFFSSFKPTNNKLFFLLTSYDKNRALSPQRLRSGSAFVNNFGNNLAVLPYNSEFGNSCDTHTAIQFFIRNSKATSMDSNYGIISECRKATAKLLKLCGSEV